MARTGRFGRQPRVASSLTNTLIAIAREYQNQRAQNIMDAWQKGGTFEGQKATDKVVLAFWKQKVAGVSKDDPLYDTYKNARSQLQYSIAESKMTASYAQHGKTDAQMVSFYLGWAKKVPKNSEFYRVLQRDAGQYMRNVSASSEAAARAADEKRYQRQQNDTHKGKEAAGEYVIDTLRRLAQSGYADGGLASAISAPGSNSDLTDFDPNDPELMLRLISLITPNRDLGTKSGKPGFSNDPNTDVLFHDDDKKGVTGADIMQHLQKLDPNFTPGQTFDVNYVTGLLDTQMQGLNERIRRARKTGHMTDVASLQKSKGYVALLNREVAAYPVQKAYQELRSDYDSVVGDPSSSPQAIMNAWQVYSDGLTGLANDPRIAADDNMRSRLVAEVNGTPGVPTLDESFTGLAKDQFDAASAKDAAENKANLDYIRTQMDAVANGTAMWTYGTHDKNGVFTPSATGREIGAATPQAIDAGGMNAQTMTIPDPLGGSPLVMRVTATPIFAVATDPVTGDKLDSLSPNPIGYAYDLPKGDGFETKYGFQTKEGFVFSSDPNFDKNLHISSSKDGGNHLEVDLTSVVGKMLGEPDPLTGKYPGDIPLTKDTDFGNGFSVRGAKPGKPGTLVFDPLSASWATGTRAGLGSTDPMTDFKSLTLANLMTDPDGVSILTNLDKNPAFKSQLEGDNYRYAGYQQDLKTGAWVPGTDASPEKLAAVQGQTNIATYAQSFSSFVAEAGKTWQRATTGSPAGLDVGQTVTKLATDLLQGTPFESLGNVFKPGTNAIKPPNNGTPGGVSIAPVGVLKVPTYQSPGGPVTVNTPVVNPPASSTAPQHGSQPPSGTTPQQGSAPPGGYGTHPGGGGPQQ